VTCPSSGALEGRHRDERGDSVSDQSTRPSWVRRLRLWARDRPCVADEADAFLNGHALERLRPPPGQQRPPWLWLNAVVHGSLFTVRRVALRTDDADRFRETAWVDERVRLAQELIGVASGDEARLRALQRQALVPLELRLDRLADLPPARLVDVAIEELHLASR
jgi:hypothetical protein